MGGHGCSLDRSVEVRVPGIGVPLVSWWEGGRVLGNHGAGARWTTRRA